MSIIKQIIDIILNFYFMIMRNATKEMGASKCIIFPVNKINYQERINDIMIGRKGFEENDGFNIDGL